MTKINQLTSQRVDNGFSRVYYVDKSKTSNRLLCYQECDKSTFQLYVCSSDGEPSHVIDHQQYVEISPLPDGQSNIEKSLTKWLVRQVTGDINSEISDYFILHHGMTTEIDSSINNTSRRLISRIHNVYGECFIVNLNLHGTDRGDRNAISKKYQKGEHIYNFSGAVVAPKISDEVIDLILKRDTDKYQGMKKDSQDIDVIFSKLDDLGGQHLHWS
jgi:hypothetical protein